MQEIRPRIDMKFLGHDNHRALKNVLVWTGISATNEEVANCEFILTPCDEHFRTLAVAPAGFMPRLHVAYIGTVAGIKACNIPYLSSFLLGLAETHHVIVFFIYTSLGDIALPSAVITLTSDLQHGMMVPKPHWDAQLLCRAQESPFDPNFNDNELVN